MITNREYIELFKNKVNRLDLVYNLNDYNIINYINYAIYDVFMMVKDYRDEYYSIITSVPFSEFFGGSQGTRFYSALPYKTYNKNEVYVYSAQLQERIFSVRCVMLRYKRPGEEEKKIRNMREVRIEEFPNVISNMWTAPNENYPVYCIERELRGFGAGGLLIHIAGLDDINNYDKEESEIVLYCKSAPSILAHWNFLNYDGFTPYVFQSLVVDRAVLYYIRDMSSDGTIAIDPMLLDKIEEMMIKNYNMTYNQNIINTPAKVKP